MSQWWTFGHPSSRANVSMVDIWLIKHKIKCLNGGHLVIPPKGKCLNGGHLVILPQGQMSQWWTFGYPSSRANVSTLAF